MLTGCIGREALEELAAGGSDADSRAHLESCATCRAELLEVREQTNLLGRLRRALDAGSIDGGAPDAGAGGDEPTGYARIGSIARGGQGEIVEALELASGRRVALKLLVCGHLATAAQRARFRREIELTRTLEHPGLVRVLAAGETPSGRPFLAMELVRGRHLDDWADEQRERAGADPIRRILQVFGAVCEAVAHAHSHGIVHRDLKPSNILVDEHDRPRVLDLGLAKSLEPEPAERSSAGLRTHTGEILGTLAWMAPERLAGEGDAGPRSDVYCLGLLLHRVVFGRPTSARAERGSVSTDARGSNGPASSPNSAREAQLVGGCRKILARALALAPAERHADAGELARDLQALLTGARRRPRPRSAVVWAAALIALGLATGGTWWTLGLRTTGPFAQGGSELLAAVDLARHESARAFEQLLDATDRSLAAAEAHGGWSPPEHNSNELGRWRLVASHVWRRHPARLRVEQPGDESWSVFHGAAELDSFWIVRDADKLTHVDLGSSPNRIDLDFVSSHGRRPGDLEVSADGRWMLIGPKLADETWDRELVELVPGGTTRRIRDLGRTTRATWARSRSWFAVLGAEGGSIQLWDPERPEPLAAFELPSGSPPRAACFLDGERELLVLDRSARSFRFALPEGRLLGEGPNMPGTVDLRALGGGWILRLGQRFHATQFETGKTHDFVRVSASARTCVLDDSRVLVYDSGQMRALRRTRSSSEPEQWAESETWNAGVATRAFAVLSASRSVAILDTRGVLTVRDLDASGLPRFLSRNPGGATLFDVEFAHAGQGWVACSGNELLLHGEDGRRTLRVAVPDDILYCLAQGQRGEVVVGTHAGRVGLLTTDDDAPPRWMHQGSSPVTALDVDPSGRLVAWGDQEGTVYLQALDEATPRYTANVPPFANRIPRLAFDWSGEALVGTLRNGRVFWWRPGSDPVPSNHFDASGAHALAIHPIEKRVVSGHDGNRIALWDSGALAPSEVHVVARETDHASIWALTFDTSGRFLAIGSGKRVTVWDWELRRTLFSAEEHDGYVFALAFHPTLPILASAAENDELLEWDFRAADHLRDTAPSRIQPASSLR